jgi:hypothetical protein
MAKKWNEITLEELLNQIEKENKEGIEADKRLLEHFENNNINTPYVNYLQKRYAKKVEKVFNPFN